MVLYNMVQMLGLYSLTESQSLGVTIINHGVDNIKKKGHDNYTHGIDIAPNKGHNN